MINKREAINFLIEECYKKFPELMKEISEEEMREMLEDNISIIVAGGTNDEAAGVYNLKAKRIIIFNEGNVSLDEIKENNAIISVLAHEGIHALFRKSEHKTRHRK